MFERFTASARLTVVRAQEEAVRLQHRHIGTEHLLLALLLAENDDPARATLEEFGVTHATAETQLQHITGDALDASALESLGIDLGEVRRRVEAQFGPRALEDPQPRRRAGFLRRGSRDAKGGGFIPFTDDAKVTLELSLREAIALQHRTIASGHILLGLLRGASGLGYHIIESQGAQAGLIRTRVGQRLRSSA